jgi:mannose-6-phosphate isomerase
MTALYPLRCEPLLRRYIWGGRRLASSLAKALPPGDDYAESWEVCDRGSDQSLVAAGPLQGVSLAQLLDERKAELLGRHLQLDRFPLLIKFLDCQRTLSVQVHPNDAQAARLSPPDLGKTEAWVVLEAEPGSVIYAGLKRGFDRDSLARELSRGTCELCLHRFEPRVGDCVFIPAGTVHALGAGLVIAEIQQSSDVTYRLFDWNRVGADGQPRPLHIDASLAAIDYARGPVEAVLPQPTETPGIERLVDCDKFVIERWQIDRPMVTPDDDRCRVLIVIGGSVVISGDPIAEPIRRGTTVLLPACFGGAIVTPQTTADTPTATLLCAYLP